MMLRRWSPTASDCAKAEPRVEGKEERESAEGCMRSEQDVEINATREAYESKRVQDGATVIMDLFVLLYPIWFTMVLFRWWIKLDTWQGFACLQMPSGIAFLCIRWNRQRLLHLCSTYKAVGVIFQSAFWILITSCLCWASLSMKSELLRHRMFLTCYIPALSCFTIVGYVPPAVYVPVCCLWNIMVWLLFHYAVGFVNIPCVSYCFVSSAMMHLVYKHLDVHAWNEFEATQALDKDRQFLKAMHDTFQGMLSSLFDASCTCDQSGAMLASTPQFRDLLGVGEESCPVVNLHQLAPSPSEADRLLQFLEQIRQSGSQRAQAIQASLHAPSSAASVREVKMFGIMLPDRVDGPTECRNKRIFIGLLGQGNSATILDTCHPQGTNLGEVIDSARPTESEMMTVLDFDDVATNNVDSLCYTMTHSSETSTNLSGVPQRQPHLQILASSTDAAIQTEAKAIDQQVLAISTDVSVQTGATSFHHFFECPRCSLPRPAEDLTREQIFFNDWKAKNRRGKKIVLNSSKLVLPDFAETPERTLLAILTQTIPSINARGRGCCRFHIIVARISHVLAACRSKGCEKDWSPFSDWQCQQCKAMNEYDCMDLEDDEGQPLCSTCGTERGPLSTSASHSGTRADSEVDHTGS